MIKREGCRERLPARKREVLQSRTWGTRVFVCRLQRRDCNNKQRDSVVCVCACACDEEVFYLVEETAREKTGADTLNRCNRLSVCNTRSVKKTSTHISFGDQVCCSLQMTITNYLRVPYANVSFHICAGDAYFRVPLDAHERAECTALCRGQPHFLRRTQK
jgi:hypothetical protein